MRKSSSVFTGYKYNNDNLITPSYLEQEMAEEIISPLYDIYKEKIEEGLETAVLRIQRHITYLLNTLFFSSKSTPKVMDCSRPWLCYWSVHSLKLMNYELMDSEKLMIISFLDSCQHEDGGFGGGPGQLPHLASSYAAVCALITLGTKEAFQIIDRKKMEKFIFSLRTEQGAFYLHKDGECDIRGAYCATAVASVLNFMSDELFENTAKWVADCQSYEGGFGAEPGLEGHGGYTCCGISALAILQSTHLCDIQRLLRWVVMRQMSFEGGFQGRPNKLVDSCYCFWQAAVFAVVQGHEGNNDLSIADSWLFNCEAVQKYILLCCQHPFGGFLDRPTNCHDSYHTCYALSSLSLAQYTPSYEPGEVLGGKSNLLAPINPWYNIEISCFQKAIAFFKS